MEQRLESRISLLEGVVRHLASLQEAGWTVEDDLHAITLESPHGPTGTELRDALGPLERVATSLRLRLQSGDAYFQLTWTSVGLQVEEARAESLENSFAPEYLEIAQRARDGDSEAALGLPGEWQATASLNLARPLTESTQEVNWRVVRTAQTFVQSLERLPWWDLAEMAESEEPTVVVAWDSGDEEFIAARLALLGPKRLSLGLPVFSDLRSRRDSLRVLSGSAVPEGLPLPEALVPRYQNGFEDLVPIVHARAAAAAWGWLGDTVTREGEAARIQIVGYRRVEFSIPGGGIDDEWASEMIDLYLWTTKEASPDRLLALRQVASLNDDPLRVAPIDLRRGAESLYVALRSGAVAEVLSSQREARSFALAAVQTTVRDAQAAVKSLIERTIVSLGAIGGIAIASATEALTPTAAAMLAYAIAGFLVFLAVWNLLVEGPGILQPLSTLGEDLPLLGDMLSPHQRQEILDMSSVKSARARGVTARISVPALYLAAGILAWCVGRSF